MYIYLYISLIVGVLIGVFIAILIGNFIKSKINNNSRTDYSSLCDFIVKQKNANIEEFDEEKITKTQNAYRDKKNDADAKISKVFEGTQSARDEGAGILYSVSNKDKNSNNINNVSNNKRKEKSKGGNKSVRYMSGKNSESRGRCNSGTKTGCNIVIRYEQQPYNNSTDDKTNKEVLSKHRKASNIVSYRNIRYNIPLNDSSGTDIDIE